MYPFYSRIHDSLLAEVKSKNNEKYMERISKLQKDLEQQKSVNLTQHHSYHPSFFHLLSQLRFCDHKFESLQICIVSVQSQNDIAKGITIDMEIIKKTLHLLGVKHIDTQFIPVPTPQPVIASFPTSSDIVIVIEIFYEPFFQHLLHLGKTILFLPNIDSYSTYAPIKKNRHDDFIQTLLKMDQAFPKFYVGCKTKQVERWIQGLGVKKYLFLSFENNIDLKPVRKISFKRSHREPIFMDTGTSLAQRKYLTEILDVFIENPSLPFDLIVKTTPIVYDRFLKNTRYTLPYENIRIINEFKSNQADLNIYYQNIRYFLYLARFDGFGLSLSRAIHHHMFIFCLHGYPWKELLENYPRKCYIHAIQDVSKNMGGVKNGHALSQIYYRADFTNLKAKLSVIDGYEALFKTTKEFVNFHTSIVGWTFLHNLRSILFQLKPSTVPSKYYSHSEIGILSYTQRGILFLENLFHLLPQSHKIVVYFNSMTPMIFNYAERINNVHIIPFVTDHRALSKFYLIPHYQTKFNFILDDDIIFPPEFISHSCSILEKNPKVVHSYNGFWNENKYSFQKVFREPNDNKLHLGTGTLFFTKSVFSFEKLYRTMVEHLVYTDNHSDIFADKFFFDFCEKFSIPRKIVSPRKIQWMHNNEKLRLFKTPGLLELKKELCLLSQNHINTLIPENVSLWTFGHDAKTNPSLIKQIKNYFFIEPIKNFKRYDFVLRGNSLFQPNGNILIRNINPSGFIQFINQKIL